MSDTQNLSESEDNNLNIENYKGFYYNDDTDEKYYEGGAHFQYLDLYRRLEKIEKKYEKRNLSEEKVITKEIKPGFYKINNEIVKNILDNKTKKKDNESKTLRENTKVIKVGENAQPGIVSRNVNDENLKSFIVKTNTIKNTKIDFPKFKKLQHSTTLKPSINSNTLASKLKFTEKKTNITKEIKNNLNFNSTVAKINLNNSNHAKKAILNEFNKMSTFNKSRNFSKPKGDTNKLINTHNKLTFTETKSNFIVNQLNIENEEIHGKNVQNTVSNLPIHLIKNLTTQKSRNSHRDVSKNHTVTDGKNVNVHTHDSVMGKYMSSTLKNENNGINSRNIQNSSNMLVNNSSSNKNTKLEEKSGLQNKNSTLNFNKTQIKYLPGFLTKNSNNKKTNANILINSSNNANSQANNTLNKNHKKILMECNCIFYFRHRV
jgi:hypothetical protein